ncbi:MAG: hypothetical protein RLZZ20_1699 [Pseudomonadota bacterium]
MAQLASQSTNQPSLPAALANKTEPEYPPPPSLQGENPHEQSGFTQHLLTKNMFFVTEEFRLVQTIKKSVENTCFHVKGDYTYWEFFPLTWLRLLPSIPCGTWSLSLTLQLIISVPAASLRPFFSGSECCLNLHAFHVSSGSKTRITKAAS